MEKNVILASNASTDTFPSNSLTCFTNVLPGSLNLNQGRLRKRRWYASLVSIAFHTTLANVPRAFANCRPHFVATSYTRHALNGGGGGGGGRTGLRNVAERQESSIPADARVKVQDIGNILNNLFDTTLLHGKLRFETRVGFPLRFSGDDAVLLIHPEIAKFFHIRSLPGPDPTYKFKGCNYLHFVFPPVSAEANSRQQRRVWREAEQSFQLELRMPKYIRVVTTDVQSVAQASENCAQTLAVLPCGDDMTMDDSFFHEVTRKIHVRFQGAANPTTLSIKLLDDLGQQLHLASGQPTMVKMRFDLKYGDKFVLPISSKDRHVEGSNSDFTIKFPSPLRLHAGCWKVALLSIQFPSRFQCLTAGDLEKNHIEVWQGGAQTVMRLDAAHFASQSLLLAELRRLVWEASNHRINIVVGSGEIGLRHVKLRRMAARAGVAEEDRVKICFDSKLALLLGLAKVHTPNNLVTIELFDIGDEHVGEAEVNLNLLTPACMISYIDIIEPSFFGSSLVKILKTIPVQKHHVRGMQSYEAKNLDHLPLIQSLIPSIEFKLLQTDGEPVTFADSTEEVLYNLQFTHVT